MLHVFNRKRSLSIDPQGIHTPKKLLIEMGVVVDTTSTSSPSSSAPPPTDHVGGGGAAAMEVLKLMGYVTAMWSRHKDSLQAMACEGEMRRGGRNGEALGA